MECAFCQEAVHPADLACPHCGSPLEAEPVHTHWVMPAAAAVSTAAAPTAAAVSTASVPARAAGPDRAIRPEPEAAAPAPPAPAIAFPLPPVIPGLPPPSRRPPSPPPAARPVPAAAPIPAAVCTSTAAATAAAPAVDEQGVQEDEITIRPGSFGYAGADGSVPIPPLVVDDNEETGLFGAIRDYFAEKMRQFTEFFARPPSTTCSPPCRTAPSVFAGAGGPLPEAPPPSDARRCWWGSPSGGSPRSPGPRRPPSCPPRPLPFPASSFRPCWRIPVSSRRPMPASPRRPPWT